MFTSRNLSSILVLAVAAACGGGQAATPADGVYTVRAEIVRLPAADGGELYLRHEEIPDFRGRDGKRSAMMSMTMPFNVEDGVELESFGNGDRVVADFEVRWQDRRPLLVTQIERLPDGTRLDFDPAPQPDDEPDDEPTDEPAGEEADGETPR
jgi:Cu/Ag efflux protein CusF